MGYSNYPPFYCGWKGSVSTDSVGKECLCVNSPMWPDIMALCCVPPGASS